MQSKEGGGSGLESGSEKRFWGAGMLVLAVHDAR